MSKDTEKPVIVAGHQPHYLPWIGYLNKIYQVDKFCLVDSVQFRKKYFQHRNKIKTKNGPEWLIVPIKTKGHRDMLISEMEIDNSTPWQRKHWKTIQIAYSKAPYFNEYKDFFEEVYTHKWEKLVDLDEHMLRGILDVLGIKKDIIKSSSFAPHGERTELLVAICRSLGGDGYLSGGGGHKYVDLNRFKEEGLIHIFQDFEHPVYPQLHGEFEPNMGIIDLLFNVGPESIDYIAGKKSL